MCLVFEAFPCCCPWRDVSWLRALRKYCPLSCALHDGEPWFTLEKMPNSEGDTTSTRRLKNMFLQKEMSQEIVQQLRSKKRCWSSEKRKKKKTKKEEEKKKNDKKRKMKNKKQKKKKNLKGTSPRPIKKKKFRICDKTSCSNWGKKKLNPEPKGRTPPFRRLACVETSKECSPANSLSFYPRLDQCAHFLHISYQLWVTITAR